jgi:opacity protein-like surface antigen
MLRKVPSLRARQIVAVAGAALLGVALVVLAPQAASAAPVAQSSYSFTSEAGDYIGGGASATYTPPAASITVSGTASYLTVNVSASGASWSIDLAAPRGETLHPGTYHDAERAAFRTGRAPGLDVSGNSRGCNQVYGQFSVDQLETDASGAISVLEARFVQRCESATAPRLNGTVRFQALPLSYRFVSDAGDYVGGGITKSYTGATTVFTLNGTTAGLTFGVSGQRDDWTVQLAPVAGEQLKVGTYDDAQVAAFREPGHPGLDVYGDGRGCNRITGSFRITQLVANASGTVTALAATFEQHCEGGAPALKGTVHYYA